MSQEQTLTPAQAAALERKLALSHALSEAAESVSRVHPDLNVYEMIEVLVGQAVFAGFEASSEITNREQRLAIVANVIAAEVGHAANFLRGRGEQS